LELEDQSSKHELSASKVHLMESKTRDAFRVLVLRRFAKWLDDVLAEEKPIDGIATELLAELEDTGDSGAVGPTDNRSDLYSTWSAMTALTQEIKLQGRAFKNIDNKMGPMVGLGESIDKLLEAHKDALSDARGIAEEAREMRTEHENELKLVAYDRARRELIGAIIDVRDKLMIGMRSASESRRKLDEYRSSSWLYKTFKKTDKSMNHMFEIVNSLSKGYRLGLDRLDESLRQLDVREIVCEGKPFDPRVMNAVDVAERVNVPDGIVLEVYRNGYTIDSEVLQPAQVKVARTLV